MNRTILAILAVLAMALATPVQAQSFGFSFGFGSGFCRDDDDDDFLAPDYGCYPNAAICLRSDQSNRFLEERGWSQVRRGSEHRNVIEMRAVKDGYVWAVFVHLCQRRIVDAEQLRPAV